MITAEHGPAISKGKTKARLAAGGKVDALVMACGAKNLSLRGLAREAASALDRVVPPSGISQARAGTRPIARDVAEYIEKRTGFKATPANWPGGID